MAAGLNKISVIGNLGKDPELRFTQGGTAVCNLRVGVTERRKEGESYKDHTEWFTIICFGKTAETAGQYLKKGRQIYAEGRLQTRNWEDREKQTRTSVEIIASSVLYLGSARSEGGVTADAGAAFGAASFAPSAFASSSMPTSPSSMPADDFMGDEDLPF